MAALIGGGDGALGGMPLQQWFFEMPVCTRWWTTATVIMGVLVQCHVLNPFQLFYSWNAFWHRGQYWRVASTFIYFGPLSLNLLFHIFFIQRYARMLEESAASTAHFTWLLAYSATSLVGVAPLFGQAFLGTALSSTLVYIWSRRHPEVRISFLGLLVFRAPWLPWVLIGFNVVLHGYLPKNDLCGIFVGHVWYFFSDIYPSSHNDSRPLDPPAWWVRLWERQPGDAAQTEAESDVHAAAMNRDVAPALPEI